MFGHFGDAVWIFVKVRQNVGQFILIAEKPAGFFHL